MPTVRRVFAALEEDKAPYDFDTGSDEGITIILKGLEGVADDVAETRPTG